MCKRSVFLKHQRCLSKSVDFWFFDTDITFDCLWRTWKENTVSISVWVSVNEWEMIGLIIVLVHARSRVPGLGSSGWLGHDDLVDLQDVGGGLSGVLDAPKLHPEGVKDVSLERVVKKHNFPLFNLKFRPFIRIVWGVASPVASPRRSRLRYLDLRWTGRSCARPRAHWCTTRPWNRNSRPTYERQIEGQRHTFEWHTGMEKSEIIKHNIGLDW